MFKIAVLLVVLSVPGFALDKSGPVRVPVSIEREEGSFSGTLLISTTGPEKKASIRWEGQIRNTSDKDVFRIEFCIQGYNRPGGAQLYPCLLRLWGNNWEAGGHPYFPGEGQASVQCQE